MNKIQTCSNKHTHSQCLPLPRELKSSPIHLNLIGSN
jgi:hypothetical protein